MFNTPSPIRLYPDTSIEYIALNNFVRR